MVKASERAAATATVQAENERVRVTEYRFAPGAETGWHRHEWDYVVVPQTDGQLILVDGEGNRQPATLQAGISYYRAAGVEHNVINGGGDELVFVEVEMKAHGIERDEPDPATKGTD